MVTIAGRCGCVSTTSVVSYLVTREGGGGAAGAGCDCGLTTTCVPGCCAAGCGACCTSTVVDGGGACGCDWTVVVVPGGTSTVVWAKTGAATRALKNKPILRAVTGFLLLDVWSR